LKVAVSALNIPGSQVPTPGNDAGIQIYWGLSSTYIQQVLQMPLRGTGHSKLVGNDAPYFESLAELDAWAAMPAKKLTGVLGFQASRPIEGLESEHRGKLLVSAHVQS